MPKVYADDGGVLSKNSRDIGIALRITGHFATVTQQKIQRRQNQGLGHNRNFAAFCVKL